MWLTILFTSKNPLKKVYKYLNFTYPERVASFDNSQMSYVYFEIIPHHNPSLRLRQFSVNYTHKSDGLQFASVNAVVSVNYLIV